MGEPAGSRDRSGSSLWRSNDKGVVTHPAARPIGIADQEGICGQPRCTAGFSLPKTRVTWNLDPRAELGQDNGSFALTNHTTRSPPNLEAAWGRPMAHEGLIWPESGKEQEGFPAICRVFNARHHTISGQAACWSLVSVGTVLYLSNVSLTRHNPQWKLQ